MCWRTWRFTALTLLLCLTAYAWADISTLANRRLEELVITGGALDVNVEQWNNQTVTGGAGAVAAGTPRVTLGSDDPAVVVLQAVGHTRNEAFGQAAAIGGELDDTAPVVATEGNVSPVRITAQRGVHANLRNNAGTEVGTATDPLRVDPTGTTRQPVDPIAGQVGVQGGSGIATALTQRAVLATDIALPAGTNILGRVGTDLTTPGTTNAVAPISGQAGVQGGSGIVTALTQRVVLATDTALPTGANVIGGVTQSGIWTVQPGNTQNTTPWLQRLHDGTNALGVFFDLDSGAGTQWELGVNLRRSASGGSAELLGQATMANSLPVVVASDQSRLPVDTISGQTGVQGGAGASTALTQRIAIATDANTIQISQTTPATTNGVTPVPTSNAGAANALTSSGAAESSNVLKASAGNLYSLTITTGATAGFLMIFNATSAPVDGAVTPAYCSQAPANMTSAFEWSIPVRLGTGITAVFSSTGCFTKTASATAAFFAQVN